MAFSAAFGLAEPIRLINIHAPTAVIAPATMYTLSRTFGTLMPASFDASASPDNVAFLVLASSVDEHPETERALVQTFVERRVDGVIIVPAGDDQSYLTAERRAGMRMVFVDRLPRHLDADSVVSTNRTGAREGCIHMLQRGHRRIAYVGDLRTIATAELRFRGYVTPSGRSAFQSTMATSTLICTRSRWSDSTTSRWPTSSIPLSASSHNTPGNRTCGCGDVLRPYRRTRDALTAAENRDDAHPARLRRDPPGQLPKLNSSVEQQC